MHGSMGMKFLPFVAMVLASCAGPIESAPAKPAPQGWAGRMQAADEHDRKADEHAAHAAEAKRGAPAWTCGWDPNLDDVATSGGERLAPTTPCWNVTDDQVREAKSAEAREREAAHTDRAVAANLVEAEAAKCGKLPERSRIRSPFSHARLVAKVMPKLQAGGVQGAQVVFEKARDLTPARMKLALDCNRAAFNTLGHSPEFAPYDPTVLETAQYVVDQTPEGNVRVIVTSSDAIDAKIILDRAQALVAAKANTPATATR